MLFRSRPFSDRWVLKHVRESPIRVALTQLKVWAPGSPKKIDEALVQELKKVPEERALQALHELPQIRRIVKKQNPIAFHLPATMRTAEGTLQVSAQVDSTGGQRMHQVHDRPFVCKGKPSEHPATGHPTGSGGMQQHCLGPCGWEG